MLESPQTPVRSGPVDLLIEDYVAGVVCTPRWIRLRSRDTRLPYRSVRKMCQPRDSPRCGSVAVDTVDTDIPCCRCIAEVSGHAEGVDYGGAIHREHEAAPVVAGEAQPGCHRLLRPCNVPACPSRDADDSPGRSYSLPLVRSLFRAYSTHPSFSYIPLFTFSLSRTTCECIIHVYVCIDNSVPISVFSLSFFFTLSLSLFLRLFSIRSLSFLLVLSL